jgi:hypothetical protein
MFSCFRLNDQRYLKLSLGGLQLNLLMVTFGGITKALAESDRIHTVLPLRLILQWEPFQGLV